MSERLKKYSREVHRKFRQAGRPLKKERESELREKMYATRYRLYDISKTSLNKLLKDGFSFESLSTREQAKVWSYIFKNTDQMDVGHLAINYFRQLKQKKSVEMIEFWPQMKTWIGSIENWAHGDMIASVYSVMLEEDPDKVYPTLEKWASSLDPWKKRMAMISLLYYYSSRKKVLPYRKIIALLEPQLEFDHYYVQKAVGWTLRELSQAYPKQTIKFIERNLSRISSTAFSAAVEKVDHTTKERFKKLRKTLRRKPKALY